MKKFLSVLIGSFLVVTGYAAIVTVSTSGTTFTPDSITITQGDTVTFILGPGHSAQEVDSATWSVNGTVPVIGFQTGFGVTENVTGLTLGVHYYVCGNHGGLGMKGRIFVRAVPVVQIALVPNTVSESAGTYVIPVNITNPGSNPTSVDVNVLAGGTAQAGVDFSYSPTTVTFPAGSGTPQSVTITIINDQLIEGNETFTLGLAFPTNGAVLGPDSLYGVTIVDDDTLAIDVYPPVQSQFENIGVVNIPVSLINTSPNATSVTVHLVPTGTTATQGSDFLFNDTTITWAPNTSGTIFVPVTVVDDAIYEHDETARFQLTGATNGAVLLNDTFLLIIRNNDTLQNCSDLFLSEYIMGADPDRAIEIFNPTSQTVDLTAYRLFISRDGGASRDEFGLSGMLAPDSVYVVVHTGSSAPMLAHADTLSTILDFDGNDAIALVHTTDTIDVLGEIGVNPGFTWGFPSGGSMWYNKLVRGPYIYHGSADWSVAQHTWIANLSPDIYDSLGFHRMAPCGSSPPKATVHFVSSGITVPESQSTPVPVIVQTINPTPGPVSFIIGHNFPGSTATYLSDYSCGTPTITHSTGVFYDTLPVTILEDQLLEPTETAILWLTGFNGYGGFIADSLYNLNITDNDVLTISFNGAGYSYVEDTDSVQIKVTLSGAVADTNRVSITLAPCNAIPNVDFVFIDTVLTFLPFNDDTQSVWVKIINDTIVEPNEQINFDLTRITGTAITAITAYTITIIDDDTPTGLAEIDLTGSVKIYPNPVSDLLILENESDLGKVVITDLVGNEVINAGGLAAGKNRIDVSGLPVGMYFVNASNGQEIFSKRFVKQN